MNFKKKEEKIRKSRKSMKITKYENHKSLHYVDWRVDSEPLPIKYNNFFIFQDIKL